MTWAASCSVPRCLSVSDDPLSSMGVGAVLCLLSQLWDSSVSSEHGSLKPQTCLPYSSTLVSMSLCRTLPYRMVKQTTVGGHTCLGSQPRSRWAQTFEGHSDPCTDGATLARSRHGRAHSLFHQAWSQARVHGVGQFHTTQFEVGVSCSPGGWDNSLWSPLPTLSLP